MQNCTLKHIVSNECSELEILHELRIHRLIYHGLETNDLVLCEECARLEGQLELLIRFLDAPTGKGVM
jgi:hypothetical protein